MFLTLQNQSLSDFAYFRGLFKQKILFEINRWINNRGKEIAVADAMVRKAEKNIEEAERGLERAWT